MLILRQSTAIDIRMGPFVDATDGVTPETGVTLGSADQAEVLKENGAATTAMAGTFAAVTGADGWYDYTVATGDVDTVGEVVFVVQDSSLCLPVFVRGFVVEEAVYDAIYESGAALAMGSVTGAVGSVTGAVGSVTGAVGSVTGAVGSVTGSVGSVVGHTAQTGDTYALANGAAGFVAIDTVVDAILVDTAEIGAAGAGLTDLGGMSTAMKAEVNAEADTALTDYDAPTKAELDVLGTAALATEAKQDTAQADLDILTGTDGATLATAQGNYAPAKVADLGTVQTADHTAAIADIPTVAEFNARTRVAASYFDPAADTVANVTTVGTTTTNTDMRGTDSALLASTFSTMFAGITALAEWLGLIAGKQTGDATALTEIKATGAGSGTYDPTTDSQEAIADAGATDPWGVALPGAYGAGTAGKIVGDNINAPLDVIDTNVDAISTEIGTAGAGLTNINLPNQTMDIVGNITGNLSGSVGSVTGAVGSVTGTVGGVAGTITTLDALDTAQDTQHATTQSAISTTDGKVDTINTATAGLGGAAMRGTDSAYTGTPPTAAAIADQVWVEAIADHSGTAGSTAEQLAAAGAGGDPWSVSLPGAYGAGTAGKIVGDNIDAPLSTIDANVDTVNTATAGLAGAAMRGTDNAATAAALVTHDGKLDTVDGIVDTINTATAGLGGAAMRGTDSAATATALATAQADLDTLTGTDGVTLATTQANYAPAKAGDNMGTVTSVTGNVGGNVTGSVGSLIGHTVQTGDSFARIGAAGAGLTVLATASALATSDGKIDTISTAAAAVQTKTDQLNFTVAGQVDSNVESLTGTGIIGDGSSIPWGPAP